jgi:serine/threonine protein kinase
MGEVYRARDTQMGRNVAIKVWNDSKGTSRRSTLLEGARRKQRENRHRSRLNMHKSRGR